MLRTCEQRKPNGYRRHLMYTLAGLIEFIIYLAGFLAGIAAIATLVYLKDKK